MGIKKTIKKFKELGFKGFMKEWGKGVAGITPLQQVKTSLWSFLPMIAGILLGITITIISKTYWLTLILAGSLPLTIINIIGTFQKFLKLKQVDEVMKEIIKNEKVK